MKVGSLAKDSATGEVVIIISENPTWTDKNGKIHRWDFKILQGDTLYYVDVDELEFIDENR